MLAGTIPPELRLGIFQRIGTFRQSRPLTMDRRFSYSTQSSPPAATRFFSQFYNTDRAQREAGNIGRLRAGTWWATRLISPPRFMSHRVNSLADRSLSLGRDVHCALTSAISMGSPEQP